MSSYVQYFFSHSGQIVSFVSVAIVWISFLAFGAVLRGPGRIRALDPIVGWAWVGFVFTISGVLLDISFTYLSFLAAFAAFGAGIFVWHRDGTILPPGTLYILILISPLLLLVSDMRASQWDEFSEWLIVPRYMLETGAFPSEENPYPNAVYTGYPYSWHFVTYLASRISGELLENAGALSNVLLLSIFGLVVVQLIARGLGRAELATKPSWVMASLGGAAMFIANPTFAQKIVLTSYAEASSAVATGAAVVLGWSICEALVDKERDALKSYAWQMGAVLALLVNLKQATLVLAILVLLASLFVAIRDRNVPTGEFLRLLPTIVLPGLVLYLVWRYHLSNELSVKEITLLPFDTWHFSLIPQILINMVLVLSKKGYYLALILIAVGIGFRGMFRSASTLDRFGTIVLIVVVGYNAFLLFAYVASFGKYDAMRVASYWRYNMHLGPTIIAFSAYGAAIFWQRYLEKRWNWGNVRWFPAALLLLAPFVFTKKIRFDKAPMTVHFRTVGAELPALLKADDAIFVCDPTGSGESAQIVQYELAGQKVKYSGRVSAFYPNRLKTMRAAVARPHLNTMIVFSMDTASKEVIGRDLPIGHTYLLQRDGLGPWRELVSWPQPIIK